MKERKYKEDYGFSTTMDHRGREKREAVYRGDWYSYQGGGQTGSRTRIVSLILLAFCVAFFLIYMKLNSPSSRCMYVMPLAACALAPLAYWGMGVFAMWRAPERMTRLQKENGAGRVLRSSVGCAVLLGMACVGDLLFMLFSLKARFSEELLAFAMLLCAAMCAMGCFLRIREVYNQMVVVASEGTNEV